MSESKSIFPDPRVARSRSVLSCIRPFLLLALALWSVPVVSGQVVAIPDPSVEQSIRNQLDKADGDITVADMQTLEYLDIFSTPLGSFHGLQNAVNLTNLIVR
jgi:hypothetical protein